MDQAARLVDLLRRSDQTLSVAESCTGGLIGAHVTAVPGSSEVFWGGVISYDDAAKRGLLGVSGTTLERFGAVSEATAKEMARGILRASQTTWSLAVTGIAGPGGGTPEKPVGTVWIAVDGPAPRVENRVFPGDRGAVREATVSAAMMLLASCVSKFAAPGGV
jgi:nicotinamide-nucleotide amidase